MQDTPGDDSKNLEAIMTHGTRVFVGSQAVGYFVLLLMPVADSDILDNHPAEEVADRTYRTNGILDMLLWGDERFGRPVSLPRLSPHAARILQTLSLCIYSVSVANPVKATTVYSETVFVVVEWGWLAYPLSLRVAGYLSLSPPPSFRPDACEYGHGRPSGYLSCSQISTTSCRNAPR